MSSLMALSIDAMLPALPQIGQDLGVANPNDNQLIISFLFLGMALGLMIYGPLADSFGRKRPLYAGLTLYILGCLISIYAKDFNQMLFGRVIQGMGLAAPRVISLAIIRDLFHGEAMARVMSFVMVVFILVPAIGPAVGMGILAFFPWQAIYTLFWVLGLVVMIWFGIRQPETLDLDKRTPFSMASIGRSFIEIVSCKEAMGPTVTIGIIFGAFLGYLSTSQQIFQVLYGTGNKFALYFGILALAFGGASMVNARLVRVYGMRRLSKWALWQLTIVSIGFFFLTDSYQGVPPFWTFFLFLAACFFSIASLFGNLNAMAMEPLGHIAGIGAAVIGTISTLISAGLGVYIGQLYDNSVLPLVGSFAILGAASLFILEQTTKGQEHDLEKL